MRKILLAAVLVVPALAWGAPTTADDWYKEGANQYTLGNYDKAVDAFKRGFELETNESKQAAYLYNIAQSYRQGNDCVKAQFFYKRFLAAKVNDKIKPLSDKDRKNVEDFIKDLEPCAVQAAQLGTRPPQNLQTNGDGSDKPPPEPSKDREPRKDVATVSREPDDVHDTGVEPALRPATAPHLISARFTAGGTAVSAGTIPVPVQATFALTVGYPIAINDKLTVELGAAGTFTPIPFEKDMGGTVESKTAQLISAVANAGISYEFYPRFAARADVGLGALFFSGVSESVFLKDNSTADGALTMLHVRAAVSADYAVTENIVVTAAPFVFSYSPPKTGLNESITALTSIDFMVGLGFRM